jgi:hypothetical protein
VLPGDYTVEITARGRSLTQTVHVRTDPHNVGTAEALRARWSMMMEIDSVDRVFARERGSFVAADSERTRLVAALGKTRLPAKGSAQDILVRRVDSAFAALRPRFGMSYPTPIGQMFDLLGGLESSSFSPTESERRTLDNAEADLRDAFGRWHALEAQDMRSLRAATPP